MDNELLRFARLAIATARRIVPLRLSKYADPTYHPASLLAALLLKEHLRLTYRGTEDLLRLSDQLRRLFGLRIVPDPVVVRPSALEREPHRGRAWRDGQAGRGKGSRGKAGGVGLDRALAVARIPLLRVARQAPPWPAVGSAAPDG